MPESGSSLAGDLPAQPGKAAGTPKRQMPADPDMYRIAYQESQRTLDDEQDELNRMRDRAVQFAAFVGAATAFLVGTGLQATHRDAAFYTLASLASALSALFIICLFIILKPSHKRLWHYRLSATSLIDGWIEAEVPPPNEASFIRAMAMKYDEMHRNNAILLKSLRRTYQWLILSGTAQVTVWAALVWVKR
jgi:hypothetical protein